VEFEIKKNTEDIKVRVSPYWFRYISSELDCKERNCHHRHCNISVYDRACMFILAESKRDKYRK